MTANYVSAPPECSRFKADTTLQHTGNDINSGGPKKRKKTPESGEISVKALQPSAVEQVAKQQIQA